MRSALRLALGRDLTELARLSREAVPFLAESGASTRTIYRARLALEEAVSNVVRHAGGARNIDVEITVAGEGVDIRVEDDGPEFDPLKAPAPDLTALSGAGGLGIYLLRRMTHDIRYDRSGSRNRLSIRI